jgi:integrase
VCQIVWPSRHEVLVLRPEHAKGFSLQNKLEAENECERLKTRRVNFGHSLSSLSAARIAEASACYARLDALGAPDVTLTAAVKVIAPAKVEKILFDAITNDLELVPFLTLAFYAGVRPDGELQKILWSDLDLTAKKHHVTIRPTIAKKRRKRWIDLSANALAWLSEYRARGGRMEDRIVPFSASTLLRKRRRNALAAGITEWPQQGARHTWCSCWLAQHGDINGLVIQAGHESATVMWNNYYQAITPEAAAAFWNIFPPPSEDRRICAVHRVIPDFKGT